MKKSLKTSIFVCFLLVSCYNLQAQKQNEEKKHVEKANQEDEEDNPTMFKFEPDFLATAEQRKARIDHARKILDTMDISDRRRRKLLKDLYKNGISERLSKTLYADTKFEDIED